MVKYVLILILGIMFTMEVYADDVPTEQPKIEIPVVEALGAILMDANTGRVLWGKNEYEPLANASTTKIMTAIVALENGNLEDIVTVSAKAAASPKVKMFLQTGEKIKLEYLMYALMLQSSNDAALAIAEHVGKDAETFCKMMTDKAKQIGALDTVFETPSGLDKGEHHTTAYDMALITKYALNMDKFVEIINTKSITAYSDKRTYNVVNKNRLLNEFEGANGVKTGFTGKAGHCFVGASKRGEMQLISVALGSGWGNKGKEQKWIDTKELLNYGFNNYKYETLVTKGDQVKEVNVDRSKTNKIGLYFKEGLVLPVNSMEKENIRIEIEAPDVIKAPIETNMKLGVAKIFIGDELCKEVDLLTNSSAQRHDLKTSLEKVIDIWLELGTNSKVNVVLPEF